MMRFGTSSSVTTVPKKDDDNAMLRVPPIPNRRVYCTVQVEIPEKLWFSRF